MTLGLLIHKISLENLLPVEMLPCLAYNETATDELWPYAVFFQCVVYDRVFVDFDVSNATGQYYHYGNHCDAILSSAHRKTTHAQRFKTHIT